MDENENYDIDELMNEALESDLLEATTAIQDTLITIHATLTTCVNLLLFADVLIALTIGVICASILSKYLHVRG
ncbi:MAG: hypothetical protein HFG50_14255 [Lachnospiraceae bacterium]|jgi:hypothetical protein|nr:hypothetical protein [Lachnospiraceae bacterium]